MGGVCKELSAELFFDEWEWMVLYCAAGNTHNLTENGYRVSEAIYDLAALGGIKGASSDGIPGVRSVWKGLEKLYTLLAYREYLI